MTTSIFGLGIAAVVCVGLGVYRVTFGDYCPGYGWRPLESIHVRAFDGERV